MSAVLLETLVWTGALIATVLLLLRRPVTRHFGPQVAYALWLLPFARLVLPPVTLPAWMAPKATMPAAPAAADMLAAAPPLAEPAIWQAATQAPAGAIAAPLTVPVEAEPQAGFDLVSMVADWPLTEILLCLWLGGAAVFLWLRFTA